MNFRHGLGYGQISGLGPDVRGATHARECYSGGDKFHWIRQAACRLRSLLMARHSRTLAGELDLLRLSRESRDLSCWSFRRHRLGPE